MSIFSGLFRSRDKPQNRTAGSNYSFLTGSSLSGKSVNERTVMQMTAVYACVRILFEAIAGLPLHLYRYTDYDGKEKAIDHPLYLLLHDEPYQTALEESCLSLCAGLSNNSLHIKAWERVKNNYPLKFIFPREGLPSRSDRKPTPDCNPHQAAPGRG